MHREVSHLLEFYDSDLGKAARRSLAAGVRELWPRVTGLNVVGLGFAPPLLAFLRGEAESCIALMPADQGVVAWPKAEPNLAALVDEDALPLPDLSVDRLLLLHHVEGSMSLHRSLRECWRVLKGDGRLIAVVPNRAGLWARSERTPFGHGQPFSTAQVKGLMRDALFTPERSLRALYFPPLDSRFLLAAAPAIERLGQRWFRGFGGVTLVEASKQVYALTGLRAPERARRASLVMPAVD